MCQHTEWMCFYFYTFVFISFCFNCVLLTERTFNCILFKKQCQRQQIDFNQSKKVLLLTRQYCERLSHRLQHINKQVIVNPALLTMSPNTCLYSCGTFCFINVAAELAIWAASDFFPASKLHSIRALEEKEFHKKKNAGNELHLKENKTQKHK